MPEEVQSGCASPEGPGIEDGCAGPPEGVKSRGSKGAENGARGQSGCSYARETQREPYLDQPATKTVRARCCGPLSAPPPDSNGVGDRPQARMCGEASSPADRNKVVHADEMKFARLSAGGRRIRTIGPSRVKSICLDTVLPPGAVEKACSERHSTLGGTGSSNPSCSRGRLEHRRFQGSDHP